MARLPSGVYELPEPAVVAGTDIEASWANSTMDDIADALTDSLSRTGDGGMLVSFRFADGTESAPGLAFTDENNSGIYRAGSGDIRFTIASNDKVRVTSSATSPLQMYIGAMWVNVVNAGADETITGDWTVSGAWTFDTSLVTIDGVDLDMRTGGRINVYNPADTESVEFYHSNPNVIFRTTDSTGQYRLYGNGQLRVYGPSETEWTYIEHSDTFATIGTNDGPFYIEPDTQVIIQPDPAASSEVLDVRSPLSPGDGAAQQMLVALSEADGNRRGFVGFGNNVAMDLRNENLDGGVRIQATRGAGIANVLMGDPNAETSLYHNGILRFETAVPADTSSGAQVHDFTSTFRPVGFNVAPPQTGNATDIFDLSMNGAYKHKTSGAAVDFTLNQDADIPEGALMMYANEAGGAFDLLEGTGVTIKWFDGAAVTTGARVIGTGAVISIYKRSLTEYHVFGSGIT